jgi:hypothetical protein
MGPRQCLGASLFRLNCSSGFYSILYPRTQTSPSPLDGGPATPPCAPFPWFKWYHNAVPEQAPLPRSILRSVAFSSGSSLCIDSTQDGIEAWGKIARDCTKDQLPFSSATKLHIYMRTVSGRFSGFQSILTSHTETVTAGTGIARRVRGDLEQPYCLWLVCTWYNWFWRHFLFDHHRQRFPQPS